MRGPDEVIPRIPYWCRCAQLLPHRVTRSAARRGLFGGSAARSSREEAERGRERPKRAAARARPCGDGTMTEALSVSLRLSSGVVAQRSSRAFAIGILDLSFFFLLFLPLFISPHSGGLSNSPQGRRRWRRFLAHAPAWRQDDCQKRARVRNVPRFVSVKGNADRSSDRWDTAVLRTGTRSPVELSVSRWVENHSHFRLLRKERLNANVLARLRRWLRS